jgi:hypothetical protein
MERRGEGCLTWQAGSPYWLAYHGNVLIKVPIEVFHEHLAAYLNTQGIELKSWHRLQKEAEDAWERQNALENVLLHRLDYWIAQDGLDGVRVEPLCPPSEETYP